MTKIVRFTHREGGYKCSEPEEQSGDYVLLTDYQRLLALVDRAFELVPELWDGEWGNGKVEKFLEDCDRITFPYYGLNSSVTEPASPAADDALRQALRQAQDATQDATSEVPTG